MFDESDTTHFCHKTFHGMLALKKYYGVINFLLQPQAYYPPNNVTKHCKDEELPDTLLLSKHSIRIFTSTTSMSLMANILEHVCITCYVKTLYF